MAGIVCPDLTIAYLYTSIRIKRKNKTGLVILSFISKISMKYKRKIDGVLFNININISGILWEYSGNICINNKYYTGLLLDSPYPT
jgi:hypothetical protein